MVRQVRIPIVVALMGMMFQMKNAKTHRARCEVWKIGDNGDHFVPAGTPENQVMGRIMNDDVVGVVAERADTESEKQT